MRGVRGVGRMRGKRGEGEERERRGREGEKDSMSGCVLGDWMRGVSG